MKKYLIGASAAAVIALAAGCGGDDMPGMDHDRNGASAPADGAGEGDHNEQDITFAQGMIPHHQQAVDMSQLAAERAVDTAVRDLAGRIESAQEPEIRQLTDLLDRWGAPDMTGMNHGDMSESGMMTDEEMNQLGQATGVEFDRLWIQMMLRHHEGAVAMANAELAKGSDGEAKALAQQIVETQEAEIAELQAMLPQ